jgi:hypothetical protein
VDSGKAAKESRFNLLLTQQQPPFLRLATLGLLFALDCLSSNMDDRDRAGIGSLLHLVLQIVRELADCRVIADLVFRHNLAPAVHRILFEDLRADGPA